MIVGVLTSRERRDSCVFERVTGERIEGLSTRRQLTGTREEERERDSNVQERGRERERGVFFLSL